MRAGDSGLGVYSVKLMFFFKGHLWFRSGFWDGSRDIGASGLKYLDLGSMVQPLTRV